jgi:hypothetical protein
MMGTTFKTYTIAVGRRLDEPVLPFNVGSHNGSTHHSLGRYCPRRVQARLRGLSGQTLTIGVGDAVPASKAAYRLQDVSEVHQRLAALAEDAAAGSGK